MTVDLSSMVDVAKAWQAMGDRFGELKGDYTKHVARALANGSWQGKSFGAHQDTSGTTAFELAAAKTEALAVASILRQGHTELARLRKSVKDLVADAEDKHFKIDSAGTATYAGADKHDKQALRNDPGYAAARAEAAQEWTGKIAKAVEAVDDEDRKVKRALIRAVSDLSPDGRCLGGFNAHAESNLDKAGRPEKKTGTKTDGWQSKGTFSATGPDAGVSLAGPGYGRQGMAKTYGDLFRVTGDGTLTREETKLSGIADLYGGGRTSTSGGISDAGLDGNAEVSGGVRALGEGRVASDVAGVYGRGSGFAGGESGVDLGLGEDGFSLGGKAFAGAKAGTATGAEAGGIGAGVTAEAWAGAGVEGNVTFGEKDGDGKFHIGAEIGASPIIGGKVGAEFVIDPGKVADTASDAAGAVKDVAGSAKDTLTDLF
ncbi:hypothetical protein [Streptomyces axinellae]